MGFLQMLVGRNSDLPGQAVLSQGVLSQGGLSQAVLSQEVLL